MAVYYKFKSAKDYETIQVDGHFISVEALKSRVYESKHLYRGTFCDLVVSNAQTDEEYKEGSMIPRNTSVLIKRVPRWRGLRIVVTQATEMSKLELVNKEEDIQIVDSSVMNSDEYTEWDVLGNDIYDIPDVPLAQASNQVQGIPSPSKVEEVNKLQALINTPALDWQSQPADGYGYGKGFRRKVNNHNFGFERTTPPPGYVCHRCNTPGHFIQNCPTNWDSNFDIKRAKTPTGIPKSAGSAGVLKPNEEAFEKEIGGLPTTRYVSDFPPELRCPLCKEQMKDAVLTSKCCFSSFCDKCIRDCIISKSMCACGATNVLADDLLPNKTLRDTINRMLESNTSSAENGGSTHHVQDMKPCNPQAKVLSPTQSAESKGGQQPLPAPFKEEASIIQDTPGTVLEKAPERVAAREESAEVKDVPGTTHELESEREPASQGSSLLFEEVQQQPGSGDAGKKKKKKTPPNAAGMQWRMAQDLPAENYMMPMGSTGYNPYIGMHHEMEGFVTPFSGNMPYMGFGLGPMGVPFGGLMPHDPFGVQGFMKPFPPQGDLGDFSPGPHPPMKREEFEARKADLNKRREMEIQIAEGRKLPKDRVFGMEVSSNGGGSSIKQKTKPFPLSSSSGQRYWDRPERQSHECRSRGSEIPHRSCKRNSDYDDYHHEQRSRDERQENHSRDVLDEPHRRAHEEDYRHHKDVYHRSGRYHNSESSSAVVKSSYALNDPSASKGATTMVKKHKPSVVAASKKRKLASSETLPNNSGQHKALSCQSNGYYEDYHSKTSPKKRDVGSVNYENSNYDRHFKRIAPTCCS